MTIDDEGCNCTCHWKNALMCEKCKVNHPERREQLMKEYKVINADPFTKKEVIL